jgi:hypothetical protein
MHLHPVLASETANELLRERTETAITAADIRRRLDEQQGRAYALRRTRRRRRLLGRPFSGPRYVA